ncbi:MAG TPA: histidinol dehydrogenase [Candidatus Acidoferrum sp.]|nr:histidinol dehydrogenase [Candidatus Acidoferrum sp.]
MRILKLTPGVQKKLLAARVSHDQEAQTVAAQIAADVRKRGDSALLAWARKLDDADLSAKNLWISQKEICSAERNVSPDFLRAIRQAARNIRRVAEKQLPRPWSLEVEPGVRIQQRVLPIESIGCYVPGGQASLVSTLLMTAIPAQAAKVPRIIAVCPRPNNKLLAAANFLGLTEVARIGGAQAIAAMAYGTTCIPRVEKIFGPGNKYVTAAKQIVSADCAIDLPAGPTEAIVLAERGNARWIAADLLAQAEHAPDAASFFVTTSSALARELQREVKWQLQELPLGLANIPTALAGAILVANSLEHACDFINRFAPEHLSLPGSSTKLLQQIRSSGTIFLGPWAAQPLGDYVSGSNHVLPTAGWARRRGGLSAADFVKCISVQTISRKGLLRLADSAETLAEAEGLLAHRNAVRIRR